MSPSHLPQAMIFCAKPMPASRPATSDVITLLIGKIVLGHSEQAAL